MRLKVPHGLPPSTRACYTFIIAEQEGVTVTLLTAAAATIEAGDLYLFNNNTSATVHTVRRVGQNRIRVTFTDPRIRYAPCAADSLHRIGRR